MLPSTDLEVFHGFLKDTYGLLAGPSSQFCFLQAFVRFTSVHVPSLGFLLLVPSFLLWTPKVGSKDVCCPTSSSRILPLLR